jgi:hypothetical protein
MQVKIGSYVLCEGNEDSPTNLQIEETRSPQVVEGLRWSKVKVYDRLNKRTTIRFTINRLSDSLGNAERFMLMHGSQVPNSGLMQITAYDGSSIFMDATSCQTVSGKQLGCTTIHDYAFVGGATQTSRPKP